MTLPVSSFGHRAGLAHPATDSAVRSSWEAPAMHSHCARAASRVLRFESLVARRRDPTRSSEAAPVKRGAPPRSRSCVESGLHSWAGFDSQWIWNSLRRVCTCLGSSLRSAAIHTAPETYVLKTCDEPPPREMHETSPVFLTSLITADGRAATRRSTRDGADVSSETSSCACRRPPPARTSSRGWRARQGPAPPAAPRPPLEPPSPASGAFAPP